MSRHAVRVVAAILGCAIYLPATALMILQAVGPYRLQAIVDWLTGHCGAGCSGRAVLATTIEVAPIAVTVPAIVLIALLWVIRGRRSDRQVKAIARHFDTAPERVSPHAIEDEKEERYLYRDRRGRLRPVHPPPPTS